MAKYLTGNYEIVEGALNSYLGYDINVLTAELETLLSQEEIEIAENEAIERLNKLNEELK